ncbi:MAG: hypothetical protein WCI45_00600 [Desulfuromonadales bacterium]
MALVNHAKKEINAKIVYYGPACSGKSTALNYIYSRIKPTLRGDLKNVPAGADNLLFFDFSPFEIPLPNGYHIRLHVYTLTGTVTNQATWKMTLKGADGILIMVDSTAGRAEDSKESVAQLRDFLSAYGVGLYETPAVLQLNSFTSINRPDEGAEIGAALDLSTLPAFCSNAASGEGLLEALTALSRQVLDRITVKEELHEAGSESTPSFPEFETRDPALQKISVDHEAKAPQDDCPHVALLSHEIVSEGKTIRIPLEINLGETLRRVVITVSVELE